MKKLLLIVSDMHLGEGKFLENGQYNDLEDFDEDERFAEFLEYYSTGTYYFTEIELILNGDIFNLLNPSKDPKFPHILNENDIEEMVQKILRGHPIWTKALKKFLAKPNKKVSYVFGNHDVGMIFEKAQKAFSDELGIKVEFGHFLFRDGVLIEHGHRFESFNTVPRSKPFLVGPNGENILNLPWASLFCLYMLPTLKRERPYIDKVRPLSLYVKWTLIHDFGFFVKLAFWVISYIIKTQFKAYMNSNVNFKTKWKLLKQITIHPKYDRNAKKALASRPNAEIVIMGHTHIAEWRKFSDGRMYLNCGTWNPVPSIDAGRYKNISHLTYVICELDGLKKKVLSSSLHVWQGKWRPFKEEISLSP